LPGLEGGECGGGSKIDNDEECGGKSSNEYIAQVTLGGKSGNVKRREIVGWVKVKKKSGKMTIPVWGDSKKTTPTLHKAGDGRTRQWRVLGKV